MDPMGMGISSVWSPCIGVWKIWGTKKKSPFLDEFDVTPLWDEAERRPLKNCLFNRMPNMDYGNHQYIG